MTNKISIGVDAQFDSSRVEQKINAMGQKIAQANKVQYNPVSIKTAGELDKILKQFDQLRRVQGDLNKRMKSTGQAGSSLIDVDWEKLYPDQHSRSRQMRKAFEYSVGPQFQGGGPNPPGRQPKPQQGPTWGGVAGNVAQAGLRAAGPAGGVAAGAVGTGMSAGFGAGAMGLLGGMLALGVGKIVGSVAEKLDQAKENDVALDRLKRTLGDVNVSFNALKTVVRGSADNLKISDDEAGKLASQFARIGNVKSSEYSSLDAELRVGGGMSRSFGLDPSQGVGMMAQMRGIGVTSNTQESRRFALLIGETIGKSNAFAKSEEVMEAIASFATSQTRNNMGAANVDGYAGMFSGMVGSGIPGLDPTGAGALLGRINAALSAGGAKGEASQFFTGSIGSSMGLNPYQTRMLREGGAFATADGMFGQGSAYARYKGLKKGDARPSGGNTFLESSLAKLRGQYGEGSDELADATANHMGIGINQAMALLSVKPNQMGKLKKYGDLTKFNAESVLSLAKIHDGTDDDRKGIYNSLMSRSDVSAAEKTKLKDDMANAGGNVDAQKEILSVLVAQKGQELTDGKVIRDQKAQIDNIATRLAGEMIPAINAMKGGILHMAGAKDGKSPREILEGVMRAEGKDKLASVDGEYGAGTSTAKKNLDAIKKQKDDLTLEYRKQYGKFTANPEEYHRQMKELSDKEAAATEAHNKAKTAYTKAIEKATQEIDDGITDARLGLAPGTTSTRRQAVAGGGGSGGATSSAGAAPVAAGGGGGGKVSGNVADFVKEHGPLADKLAAQLGVPADAILGQWGLETGWGRSVIKGTNNLGNIKDFSGRGPTARDNMTGSVDSYRAYGSTSEFGDDFSKLLGKGRYAGARGTKDAQSYFSGLKAGGYAEDPNYVSKGVQAAAMAARARATPLPGAAGATPLPDGAGARSGDARMMGGGALSGAVDVNLTVSQDGKVQTPQGPISVRVGQSKPFGAGATGSW